MSSYDASLQSSRNGPFDNVALDTSVTHPAKSLRVHFQPTTPPLDKGVGPRQGTSSTPDGHRTRLCCGPNEKNVR